MEKKQHIADRCEPGGLAEEPLRPNEVVEEMVGNLRMWISQRLEIRNIFTCASTALRGQSSRTSWNVFDANFNFDEETVCLLTSGGNNGWLVLGAHLWLWISGSCESHALLLTTREVHLYMDMEWKSVICVKSGIQGKCKKRERIKDW